MFAVCYGKFKAGKRLEISKVWQVPGPVAPVPYLLIAELAVKVAQGRVIIDRTALDTLNCLIGLGL
jgi:hypothetical protein